MSNDLGQIANMFKTNSQMSYLRKWLGYGQAVA
jgi:hypothetical protein